MIPLVRVLSQKSNGALTVLAIIIFVIASFHSFVSSYALQVHSLKRRQVFQYFCSKMSCPDKNMLSVYEALAKETLLKYESFLQSSDESNDACVQFWIGIAGPPGSGKSSLASCVCNKLTEMSNKQISVVLPMDGYHYTRARLKEIGSIPNGQYTYEDLLARRGSPWTFDAQNLVLDLSRAKSLKVGSFPIYDRKRSDPVPNGVHLLPSHRIVLVEGNYLLNFDDPQWAPLKDVFDEKWFISCPSDVIRERLVRRHLETWSEEKTRMWGAGVEGAKTKAEANDLLNAQFIVDYSQKYADKVIESY